MTENWMAGWWNKEGKNSGKTVELKGSKNIQPIPRTDTHKHRLKQPDKHTHMHTNTNTHTHTHTHTHTTLSNDPPWGLHAFCNVLIWFSSSPSSLAFPHCCSYHGSFYFPSLFPITFLPRRLIFCSNYFFYSSDYNLICQGKETAVS